MRNRLLAALLAGLAPLAYATHPLVTDDPNTQGSGHHQIEANTDWARQDDLHKHVGSFIYSYGAIDNLDVFVGVPLTFTTPTGVNDVSLGAKWRMLERGRFSVAIKPELILPTGDEMKGLGNGLTSADFTGIVAYDAEPWQVLWNIGVAINRFKLQDDRDAMRSVVWRTSTSVWYSLNEQWKLLSDLGVERAIDNASNSLPGFWLFGVLYSPTPNLDLDAGLRFDQRCSACSGWANRQIGVGLTARF